MNQIQQLSNEWWTATQAGWIGGAIGILGALFGTVLGGLSFLVQQGKAKWFMLGGYGVMTAIGFLALVALVVALVMGQPRHVIQPLLLAGPLFTVLGLFLGIVVRRQYRAAEERKLDAAQIRGA